MILHFAKTLHNNRQHTFMLYAFFYAANIGMRMTYDNINEIFAAVFFRQAFLPSAEKPPLIPHLEPSTACFFSYFEGNSRMARKELFFLCIFDREFFCEGKWGKINVVTIKHS